MKRPATVLAGAASAIWLLAGIVFPAASTAQVALARTASGIPAHIETWAYDGCGNGGMGAGAGLIREWVTYAETNCGAGGEGKALRDCHAHGVSYCRVLQYADTNIASRDALPSSFFTRASSSWWLHARSGSALTTGSGGKYINQLNGAVRAWWQGFVGRNFSRADGLMMDDQSAAVSQEFYYAGTSSSSEIWSTAQLQAAHTAMSAAMRRATGAPYFQVDNTLPPNPWLAQGLSLINPSIGVYGLIAEGEPEAYATLDPYYSTLLDQIAYVANRTAGFVVPMSYGAAGASYQTQSRRVHEGTMLLGYSPGHLVDWPELEQGSDHLSVWPEAGIYPTAPVESMRAPGGAGCLAGHGVVCSVGGHNDIEVAYGVYRREFAACYDRGVLFGACATIVNTRSTPVTVRRSWLRRSYRHQITLIGGDVQSGGRIDVSGTTFTAGSTVISARDAALLAS